MYSTSIHLILTEFGEVTDYIISKGIITPAPKCLMKNLQEERDGKKFPDEGEVISRDNFLDDVWGYDSFPTTRTVDNYILSLRKQIEDDPSNPVHVITIHKAGYKFVK